MSSANMVATYLSWLKFSDVTPKGVGAHICPSYLSEEHHLAMVPVDTLNHVLLQEGGIHAEVNMKDNSDLKVLSLEATTKAYHCVLLDNDTLRPRGKVPAQRNHH